MTADDWKGLWRRLAIEGPVIVISILLVDGRTEGLLSLYLLRQKFVVTEIDDFMASQADVLALIEAKVRGR